MKRTIGILLMALGVIMITCSVVLFVNNQNEDKQAQESTEYYLPQLIDTIKNNTENSTSDVSDDISSDDIEDSDTSKDSSSGTDMTVVYIDGHGFIGYLSIPKLNLELPIMSELDYAKLKISPCRFYGSAKTANLIVGAHNYSRHFGQIGTLNADDEIYVTDMNGEIYRYAVVSIDILQPYEVDILTNEEYDLVLFTCTYGGQTRIAVGCDRIQ